MKSELTLDEDRLSPSGARQRTIVRRPLFRSRETLLVIALLAFPCAARAADLPLSLRLYGFLNAEIEWVRALGGATPYRPRRRVSDGNSRFGIFGAWDMTEQTQVQVQLEALLNNFEQGGINDQGHIGTITSRNSFVGVSDKRLGTLLAGYYDNAYRSLVGSGGRFGGNLGLTELGLDLWNNTSAALSGGFGNLFGRGEARLANSIHYHSPGSDGTTVRLQGFQENTGGFQNPQYPLVMSLENVVATDPQKVNLIASDTQLSLRGVNLYLFPTIGPRMVVNGTPTQAVEPAKVLDCRRAFVPFPSSLSPIGATWTQP